MDDGFKRVESCFIQEIAKPEQDLVVGNQVKDAGGNDMAAKRTAIQNLTMAKAAPKRVQFEFSAPEAHEVFVTGEFNKWDTKANPMKKDANGMWKVIIPLTRGRYEYRFVLDGGWENDRSCSGCVPNNFGSLNCVKIVV